MRCVTGSSPVHSSDSTGRLQLQALSWKDLTDTKLFLFRALWAAKGIPDSFGLFAEALTLLKAVKQEIEYLCQIILQGPVTSQASSTVQHTEQPVKQ
jgi:hypothetical protein